MTSLRRPTHFRRSSRHHNMWGTESGPYMIILRQGPEGEKYEMTEMCFLAKKLIPYWLFPLSEQELIWSSSIRAGPCARVWEWEQQCFAKSVFRDVFWDHYFRPSPGGTGGDCLTGKACQDGDQCGHMQIQKPSTRGIVLDKFWVPRGRGGERMTAAFDLQVQSRKWSKSGLKNYLSE